MAEQIGYLATVYVSTNGGSTYTKVGEVKDPTLSGSQDLHDATSNDDTLWKVYKEGHKEKTISFTCNYDESDVGQEAIRTAYGAGTVLNFKYRPSGDTAGKKEWIGVFKIESSEISNPTQGLAEYNVSLKSSGALTYQNIT